MKNRGVWLLLALSAVLCLLRFLDLGSAPFINDEPNFQLMLDGHLRNHTVPLLALVGSQGVSYGPTALWFYYPIRLFTSDVNLITAYFAMIFIAGLAFMVAAVWKSTRATNAAWMAALISSAPLLFFYSRLAWDNSFLIFLVGLLSFLVVRLDQKQSYLEWALLGLVSALIFNLHLMGVPVIAAAGLTLLPALRRQWRESGNQIFLSLGAASFCFVAIVLPYLIAGWSGLSASRGHFDLRFIRFGAGLSFAFNFFSWSGMGVFLEGAGNYLDRVLPGNLSKLYQWDPSLILKTAATYLLLRTGWKLIRREKMPAIQRLGFFSFVLLFIYYGGLELDLTFMHYFMPIWWVGFFFAVAALAESKGWMRKILVTAAALTVVMNVIFVFAAHDWISENHGTRGIYYGPVHSELERSVSEICENVRAQHGASAGIPVSLDFSQITGIFSYAISYDFNHAAACNGAVNLVDSAFALDHYRLRYRNPASTSDSSLAWDWLESKR